MYKGLTQLGEAGLIAEGDTGQVYLRCALRGALLAALLYLSVYLVLLLTGPGKYSIDQKLR